MTNNTSTAEAISSDVDRWNTALRAAGTDRAERHAQLMVDLLLDELDALDAAVPF